MQNKTTITTSELDLAKQSIILLSGHPNFRDLGGYRNKEGKYIKQGLIYRSSAITTLSLKDRATLDDLNIKTVIDFRSKEEISQHQQLLPSSVSSEQKLCINPGNISAGSIKKMVQDANKHSIDDFLIKINEHIVLEAQQQYRAFFRLIEQQSNSSIIFNCTAGKDRTGLAAALFLWALKVDKQTIMQDYLQSNQRLQPSINSIINKFNITDQKSLFSIQQMYSVKENYLQHAFDIIEEKFDSVDNYLTDVLKIDALALQEIYLDKNQSAS